MARIIELDALVPDDVVFQLNGKKYAVPGDPDVEMILRLIKLSARVGDADNTVAKAGTPAAMAKAQKTQEDAATELRDELLGLFQVRQPDMERLPFGMIALQHVLAELFREVGLVSDEEVPTKATRKNSAGSRKSKRSSGSRAS
jgi:hypothetical protein